MKIFLSICAAIIILSGCNNHKQAEAEALRLKQVTIDSLNGVMAKQHIIDSMTIVTSSRNIKSSKVSNDNIEPKYDAVEAKPKKKGWSNIAKGAVIGAGTGAIAGALIDKKHGEGAIVGGLLGAGAGVATGAIIDGSKKKKAIQ